MSLELDIKTAYKNFHLELSFTAKEERVGILGASGCGKSMTLKSIAGMETPQEGRIAINGLTVFEAGKKINLPPQKRKAGYLFQSYALFPPLTVGQNLALSCSGLSKSELKLTIEGLLDRFELGGLANRYPSQLSGGQQQRVALARMLASKPEIILLDEPFSALDAFLRRQVEDELSSSLEQFGGTILLVSHDRDEVFRFCDRVIILEAGRIVREGNKTEVFDDPRTVAAARLTGCRNLESAIKVGDHKIAIPSWGLILNTEKPVPDTLTHAGIRSQNIREIRSGDYTNCFEFSVTRSNESAHTMTEHLTAMTVKGYAGSCREVRRKALLHEGGEPLDERQTIRYCLPPESILLLT